MKIRKLRHIQAYRSRYRLRWYYLPADEGITWAESLRGPVKGLVEATDVPKALLKGEIGTLYGVTMYCDTTASRK